jgi:hypothetical protein
MKGEKRRESREEGPGGEQEGKGGVEAARRVATVERWLWRVWATSQYRIFALTLVQFDQKPNVQPSSRSLIAFSFACC